MGVFTSPTGDPSGDGKIDLTDSGILKDDFGKTTDPKGPSTLRGDINADHKVDLTGSEREGGGLGGGAARAPAGWRSGG